MYLSGISKKSRNNYTFWGILEATKEKIRIRIQIRYHQRPVLDQRYGPGAIV